MSGLSPLASHDMWHTDSLIKPPVMRHIKHSESMPDGIIYIIINQATLNKDNSYYDSSLSHSRLDSILKMCCETVFFCTLDGLIL